MGGVLKEANVREARLHDARHAAATVLLVLGINQRAVMGLMGWSNNAMTTRYQHLTPDLRHDIARQVDELLWRPRWTDETRDETTSGR
jgi:integrase